MPRTGDSDLNRAEDEPITLTELVDCPSCGTTFDGIFPTEARDEDGLADVTEVEAVQHCPACGDTFDASASGWLSYGNAG